MADEANEPDDTVPGPRNDIDPPDTAEESVTRNKRPAVDDASVERSELPDPEMSDEALILRIQGNEYQSSIRTFGTLVHDMDTVACLDLLSKRYKGSAFTERAAKAGIKRTRAKAIIQYNLHNRRADIFRDCEIKAGRHKAKTGHETFRYPSLSTIIGWYRPDPETQPGPPAPNQSPNDVRAELLKTADALTIARQQIEMIKQDVRQQNIKHAEDIEKLERRLRQKDQRVTDLESKLAAMQDAPEPEAEDTHDSEPGAVVHGLGGGFDDEIGQPIPFLPIDDAGNIVRLDPGRVMPRNHEIPFNLVEAEMQRIEQAKGLRWRKNAKPLSDGQMARLHCDRTR
jgi:hypothetical protein